MIIGAAARVGVVARRISHLRKTDASRVLSHGTQARPPPCYTRLLRFRSPDGRPCRPGNRAAYRF